MTTRMLPVVLALAACSGATYLPDGGRVRNAGCSNDPSAIGVIAKDAMGQPVSGAEVTAKNTTNGKTQTGTTGGDGKSNQFNDQIGDGEIEFTATNGTISTRQPFVVHVTCGVCDCTATPSSATLTLQ